MTSDWQKCGFSSLLPMSCRERAEAFARHLHSRLTSLGSEEENGIATENSWLAAPENPLTLSQPRHVTEITSKKDFYLVLDAQESPGSPTEELDRANFDKFINRDSLFENKNCQSSTSKETSVNHLNNTKYFQNDSDSDGPFYDSQTDLNPQNEIEECNGLNGLNHESTIDKGNNLVNGIEKSCSITDTLSTTDTQDEDSFLDCSSSLSQAFSDNELDKTDANCNSINKPIYTTSLSIEKELTVESPNQIQLVVTPSQFESNSSISNGLDEEDTETDERIPRVRRCSSLKTGKTPPGTPGRKKIVRFADVLGLDLADVRTFLDEIPKIPNSAYNDLQDVDLKSQSLPTSLNTCAITVEKILIPLFQQPGGLPDFIDRIRENQVCLDNAVVADPVSLSISGIVRVKNLDFHKSVHVRYTLDSWHSFADVPTVYVENSCDGFSDKFSFLFYANNLTIGQRLEFAIRFQCKGCQYWDNNHGKNYCFQCLPASNNTSCAPVSDDNWPSSFY